MNTGTDNPQAGWGLIVVDAAQTYGARQPVSQSIRSLKTQAVTGG